MVVLVITCLFSDRIVSFQPFISINTLSIFTLYICLSYLVCDPHFDDCVPFALVPLYLYIVNCLRYVLIEIQKQKEINRTRVIYVVDFLNVKQLNAFATLLKYFTCIQRTYVIFYGVPQKLTPKEFRHYFHNHQSFKPEFLQLYRQHIFFRFRSQVLFLFLSSCSEFCKLNIQHQYINR